MATGEQIRDGDFMARAFGDLIAQRQEFPIRVQGAKTLPYTAILQDVDAQQRKLVLKLFRPLPPALAMGASFELMFATQGLRYEGQFVLQGRAGYLQYQFSWPQSLTSSDRRLWKRYPFRPRENVYVTAQDSEVPCHGLTGPLINLSQGGCCFRVDRMVRLEDGLPIRLWGNLFDKGKTLSLVRIHGLVKAEALEVRGQIERIQEGDSQIHLGIEFSGLGERERMLLTQVLGLRERQTGRSGGSGSDLAVTGGTGKITLGADDGAPEEEAEAAPAAAGEASGPAAAGLGPLLRLDRRSTRLLLVAAEGEHRAGIEGRLQSAGFWRVETAADLFAGYERHKQTVDDRFRLLLVDLEPHQQEGLEAVGAVRHLEPLLRSFGELPVAFITKAQDPMLELLDKPGVGAVAQEDPDPLHWAEVLDRLLSS